MTLTQVSTGGIKDGQVQTADLADGQVTAGKLHADALDRTYTLGASGTNHYTFTGEGLTGAVNDPTLYLTRGKTYRFVNGNSAGAHPFRIQTTVNGSAGTEYNTGVTNNGGAGGSTIVFEVPHDAPDVLYYQCTSHGSMGGILYVTGALTDGVVTAAKIASGAVETAKLADQAVTLAKLPHGTSSNDGKFLRANNGADPTFETVSTDLVADTSPQLGGDLASNGNNILIADNDVLVAGTGTDLKIWHDGSNSYISNDTGALVVQDSHAGANAIIVRKGAEVELMHNNSQKFETTSYGTRTTGYNTQSAPVSWAAYGDNSWTTLTAGNAVDPYNFNNIAHNIGSHYKNSGTDAGKFVAPIGGVYQLNWNIFCACTTTQTTSATLELYIKNNNNTISQLHNKKGYGNMGDDQEVIHLSVAWQLSANDKVSAILTAYGATWQIYGGHTTFSGFLIG